MIRFKISKIYIITSLILCTVLCQISNLHANETTKLLVTVNGDSILTTDLEREILKVHTGFSKTEKGNFDYRKLLDKLVNDRLLIQEAMVLDFDQEEWLLDEMEQTNVEMASKYYVADNFKPDLAISDETILTYFNKNYSKSQVRIISIPTLEQAESIKKAIDNGAAMDSIAIEQSVDMYKFRGGLQNIKYWSDIEVPIRLQLMNLDVGELSNPFNYRDIYAVIRKENYATADTAELDKFRPGITATLKNLKKKAEWKLFIGSLEEKYPITIDSTNLGAILSDTSSMLHADFLEGSDDNVLFLDSNHFVTANDLRSKISHASMTISKRTVLDVIEIAIDESKEELLFGAAVENENYLNDPRVNQKYDRGLDSILVELYLHEIIKPQIVFNRAEFDEYYKNHLDDFMGQNEYQLHWIVAADEKIANEISQRLKDGANIDFIVKQYDDGTRIKESAKKWMNLETFPPQISSAIRNLKIAQSSDPFETEDGFIIFNVKDIKPGKVKPIDEVEMEIREIMFGKKFREILDKNLEALKNASDIIYNEKNIKAFFES